MDTFTVLENTYYIINRDINFYKDNFGHTYYVNVQDEETQFIDKLFKNVENKLTPSDKMLNYAVSSIYISVVVLEEYLKRNNIKYVLSDMDDIFAGFSKIENEKYNFSDKTFKELDGILFGLLTDGIDLESRKKSGSERTPNEIITYMLDMLGYDKSVSTKKSIIDPACGTGTFVKQIMERFIGGLSDNADLQQLLLEDKLVRAYDTKPSNVFVTKIVIITSLLKAGCICDIGFVKMLVKKLPIYCQDFLEVSGNADYIVGNPPYIRLQNLTTEVRAYIKKNFKSSTGRFDIFTCFIEHGDKLLKPNGRLCLITSNKYLTANYGVGIRSYLVETGHVRKIVDLCDTRFFGAAVLPAIILCENSNNKSSMVEYIGIKTTDKKSKQRCSDATELFKYIEEIETSKEYIEYGDNIDYRTFEISKGHSKLPIDGKTWNFSSDNESQIKIKMEQEKLCCLQDILDVCVGIKTTADTIFVKPMTEDFIKENKFEDEVVYPLIQSFDVEKWSINWGNNNKDRYILYPHKEENGVMKAYPLEEIPNAAKYLSSNSEVLKGRRYLAESKTREWYECWVPQKLSKFRQIKIVTRDIVSANTFALDEQGYLCQGNTFFLTKKDSLFVTEYEDMSEYEFYSFVLGLLNSTALEYYQKLISGCLYSQKYRYTTTNLNKWPIPRITKGEAERIAMYVDSIMNCDMEVQEAERKINDIVFNAFSLSDSEINQINKFVGKEADNGLY